MKRATTNLMGNVKEVWLTCFPDDNKRVVDYLFKSVLVPHDTIIEVKDNRLASALSKVGGAIMFNGRVIGASTIVLAASMPKYQGLGLTENMLLSMIDNLEHSELVSLACCKNPELFIKYGFKVLYRRNKFELTRDDVQRITNDGCLFDPSALDLLKIYSSFMKRFNGYRVRTVKDFEKLRQGIVEQGGKIVAYYENNEIKGYGILRIENKVIYMDECVYTDTLSLYKLINVALQQRHTLYLSVSSAENLEKLFKNAKHEVVDYMMMRLNNKELFNRLYNTGVYRVEELADLNEKPLYVSEFY